MEEIFLRFPHLSENIFEFLDNQSLAKSRKVCKTWNRHLEDLKFLQIRIIKSLIEKYDKVGEPWKKIFRYADKKIMTYFRIEIMNQKYLYLFWRTNLTPMHFAALIGNKNEQLWKFIIEKSENKNPRSNNGLTPLHLAAFKNHFDCYKNIMRYVEENNQDINPGDENGNTPFHKAAFVGNFEICKYVIEKLKEKNPPAISGKTPLHDAAQMSRSDVCKLILENVEDKNPRNMFGKTPLDLAKEEKHGKIIKLFSSYV